MKRFACVFISVVLPLIGVDHVWCQDRRKENRGAQRALGLHSVWKTKQGQFAKGGMPHRPGSGGTSFLECLPCPAELWVRHSNGKKRQTLSLLFAGVEMQACFLLENAVLTGQFTAQAQV